MFDTCGLIHIDSMYRIAQRGTWRHAQSGAWYENDFSAGTSTGRKKVLGIRTLTVPFSDHRAKVAA
eukprot:6087701-Pyramimonas_sp.AAC.1